MFGDQVDRTPYGTPFWNTEEYKVQRLAEEVAAQAELDAMGEGVEQEEEPEPFWTGISEGIAKLGEVIAPAGTPTGDAIRGAMEETGAGMPEAPQEEEPEVPQGGVVAGPAPEGVGEEEGVGEDEQGSLRPSGPSA